MAVGGYVKDTTDPILFCPKNRTEITASNSRYYCYGLVTDVTPANYTRVFRSTKQRKNPSMLILLGDASSRVSGDTVMVQGLYNQNLTTYNGAPFLIHSNTAPYAFLDGHVMSMRANDWPNAVTNKYFWVGHSTNTARFRGYKLSDGTLVTY